MTSFDSNKTNMGHMDAIETHVIYSMTRTEVLVDIDISAVIMNLLRFKNISNEVYKTLIRFVNNAHLKEDDKKRRIFVYLTSRLSFMTLVVSLITTGHPEIAKCLLDQLKHFKQGEEIRAISIVPVRDRRAIYAMVKSLKQISDSNMFGDQSKFIRSLAIKFSNKLSTEMNVMLSRKCADKYFAVLSVELDNSVFSANQFVTVTALLDETQRVIPLTNDPVVNTALVQTRKAEVLAYNGDTGHGREIIQSVLGYAVNFQKGQEVSNILYGYVTILMMDLENNPNEDTRKFIIQSGYNGIQSSCTLENVYQLFWSVCFLLRMAFCELGLSIRGHPIAEIKVSNTSLQQAEYFLNAAEKYIHTDVIFGLRRLMFLKIARGRMLQLKADIPGSLALIREAEDMAKKGGFTELMFINQYKNMMADTFQCCPESDTVPTLESSP